MHTCTHALQVRYNHIYLVAKLLPPADFVAQVCAVAAAFWKDNPGDFIAIHCAYGERACAKWIMCTRQGVYYSGCMYFMYYHELGGVLHGLRVRTRQGMLCVYVVGPCILHVYYMSWGCVYNM